MILLGGLRSDAPPERNAEQVWRLLARQHPQRGVGDRAMVRTEGSLAIGATGSGTLASAPDTGLMLVADARLDGRAELCEALGRTPERADADLILAAWLRWGTDAPQHLHGDYAFVVWDSGARRLFLVRDALGQRPLCYLADGSAFASRADAFGAVDARHGQPCEAGLAAQLAFASAGSATLYEGVERVQPGEAVVIEDGRIVRERWWRPSLRPSRDRSVADTLAEARGLLEAAVADRVADARTPIATHLSAGLDSGVATALASRLKPAGVAIDAFTAVPVSVAAGEQRLVDESAHAALAAAALPGVRHHTVSAQGDPLCHLAAGNELYQNPLPNPHNYGWVAAINDAAQRAGAGILLIGQAGNYSFSMGGDPHRRLKRAAKAVLSAFRPTRASFSLLASKARAQIGTEAIPSGGSERRLHFLLGLDPGPFMKGIAAGWGLDVRDPFADRDFVEFSLTIPEPMLAKLGDRGLGRPIARDLLPAPFVDNRARGYQSWDWTERLRRHAPAVRAIIERAREHDMLGNLLDLDAVTAAGARLDDRDAPGPADEQLYRVDLPHALATIAFVDALARPVSRAEPSAWRGARL